MSYVWSGRRVLAFFIPSTVVGGSSVSAAGPGHGQALTALGVLNALAVDNGVNKHLWRRRYHVRRRIGRFGHAGENASRCWDKEMRSAVGGRSTVTGTTMASPGVLDGRLGRLRLEAELRGVYRA